MPLDLVGKLHRTVYIEGCPSAFCEDFLRLLVTKCGAVEGWDVVDERMIVVFSSVNSVSTAITFNGTAFGDMTNKLQLWLATESPRLGATQPLAILGGGYDKNTVEGPEKLKAAREAREKRRAAIRAELTSDITEDEGSAENMMRRRLDLCARQLRALCVISKHELMLAENKLEESKGHMHAAQRLLKELREKSVIAVAPAKPPNGVRGGCAVGNVNGSVFACDPKKRSLER